MQDFAVIDSFLLVSIYSFASPVRSPAAGGGGEEMLAFSRLRMGPDPLQGERRRRMSLLNTGLICPVVFVQVVFDIRLL